MHAYEDGAPPAHDGGHGPETCAACHSDNDVNVQPGRIVVEGLPARGTPGQEYMLRVVLQHPELRSGGLQASLSNADGLSAGKLEPVDDRTSILSVDGVDYLQHARPGFRIDATAETSWEFRWRAPDSAGVVTLHVAANASNDDRSALGDYVFTLRREIVIAD